MTDAVYRSPLPGIRGPEPQLPRPWREHRFPVRDAARPHRPHRRGQRDEHGSAHIPELSQANTDPSVYEVLGRRYYLSLGYSSEHGRVARITDGTDCGDALLRDGAGRRTSIDAGLRGCRPTGPEGPASGARDPLGRRLDGHDRCGLLDHPRLPAPAPRPVPRLDRRDATSTGRVRPRRRMVDRKPAGGQRVPRFSGRAGQPGAARVRRRVDRIPAERRGAISGAASRPAGSDPLPARQRSALRYRPCESSPLGNVRRGATGRTRLRHLRHSGGPAHRTRCRAANPTVCRDSSAGSGPTTSMHM